MKYTMVLPDSVVKGTAALAEDPGSIVSFYVVAPSVCNSRSRGSDSGFYRCFTHTIHRHMCGPKHPGT